MRRQAALGRLLSYPPSLLVKGIGEEEFREGTLLLFEGLQCHQLNKQVSWLTPNHTSLAAQTPPLSGLGMRVYSLTTRSHGG